MQDVQIKRINWIDIAKAFGILIVLAFHACPRGYIKNFLWQMHMPLFAFLSGIVYSKKYSSDIHMLLLFVKKRIETIYIPFVSYSLVFLAFHNFLYKINFIGPINGNKILSGGGYIKQVIAILTLGGGESLTGALWYLIPLLELEIVFAILLFLSEISKKYSDAIAIFVCIAIYLLFANANLPRNLSNAARLLLFYCFGYFCKKYRLFDIKGNVIERIAMVTSCFAIWMFCTLYSTSWQGENLCVTVLSASTGIYCVIAVSKFIEDASLKKITKILQYIGKKTMPIVALHFLMYCFVKIVYVKIYHMDNAYIATKEAITDPKWVGIYVLSGLLGSLAMDFIIENMKIEVLKIGGKILHGGAK